jgi:hypothetical protein
MYKHYPLKGNFKRDRFQHYFESYIPRQHHTINCNNEGHHWSVLLWVLLMTCHYRWCWWCSTFGSGHDTSTRHWCNLSRRRHCPGLIYCIVLYKCPRVYPSQLTVAIGHATNAGLLAVRILSTNRHDWRQPMIQYPTENERNGRGSECQIDTLR